MKKIGLNVLMSLSLMLMSVVGLNSIAAEIGPPPGIITDLPNQH